MKLPKFLEDYLFYTQNNETPETMHLWVGLSTLAGAVEKRLWLDRGFFKLYMNLYIVLVAPPGVCAKTTSLGIGTRLLKEAGYNIFEDSVLKEKIIMEMCELEKEVSIGDSIFRHSSITYIASELNVLLSSGVDMVKFLVNIWDKDDILVYKTKNAGTFEVNNPYFNLIGAVVPEWFGKNVVSDINSTGFLARTIIIYADEKRGKVPSPCVSAQQKAARQRILDHLVWVGGLFGEIKMSEEASSFYDDWYMAQDIDTLQDHRLVAYQERKVKTHVMKVATLLAIADKRLIISVKDLELAIKLFAVIEKKMRIAFVLSSSNPLAQYAYKVLTILNRRGGRILLKDLIRTFHVDLDMNQFKDLLALMADLGDAYVEVDKGQKFLVSTEGNKGSAFCSQDSVLRKPAKATNRING